MYKSRKLIITVLSFLVTLNLGLIGFNLWLGRGQTFFSFEKHSSEGIEEVSQKSKAVVLSEGLNTFQMDNGEMVYEYSGIPVEVVESENKIVFKRMEVIVEADAIIREVVLDSNGKIQHIPRTLGDLIPGETKVIAMCTDSTCTRFSIVSIVDKI
ncbi:MAG: hypothetical protein ACOX50_00175 [Patescibacteria group bacterium]